MGAAVGDRYSNRWSYIKGSSRRRLPELLSRLSQIDLFIHDSLHSERNVRFELDRAWTALRPGGALVVDDVDANNGFQSFTQNFSGHQSLICDAEPLRPDPEALQQKGAIRNYPQATDNTSPARIIKCAPTAHITSRGRK